MTQTDKDALSTAPTPSYLTLPEQREPLPSLLDYLDRRFPHVGRQTWLERIELGKISDENGDIISAETPYRPHARLRYFREITQEEVIPFQESILFQNSRFLIADKPHFLPVTPSGRYVNECLLHRLKRRTGLNHLVPVHRLDRETAGLVMFTTTEQIRRPYFELFRLGAISKRYEAIASLPGHPERQSWQIESRIERGEPWLRFQNTVGEINARSTIRLLERRDQLARFELHPITGKTHQLRLHMQLIGSQIVGDRLYPDFQQPRTPQDFSNPLQLLAKDLSFCDPENGETHHFESQFKLNW